MPSEPTPQDIVYIHPPTVARGINQWETAAGELSGRWPGIAAALRAINAARPWGTGTEGARFYASYFDSNGPNHLLDKGDTVVNEIEAAGPAMRTTIANSVTTDEAEAERIKRLLL